MHTSHDQWSSSFDSEIEMTSSPFCTCDPTLFLGLVLDDLPILSFSNAIGRGREKGKEGGKEETDRQTKTETEQRRLAIINLS